MIRHSSEAELVLALALALALAQANKLPSPGLTLLLPADGCSLQRSSVRGLWGRSE